MPSSSVARAQVSTNLKNHSSPPNTSTSINPTAHSVANRNGNEPRHRYLLSYPTALVPKYFLLGDLGTISYGPRAELFAITAEQAPSLEKTCKQRRVSFCDYLQIRAFSPCPPTNPWEKITRQSFAGKTYVPPYTLASRSFF